MMVTLTETCSLVADVLLGAAFVLGNVTLVNIWLGLPYPGMKPCSQQGVLVREISYLPFLQQDPWRINEVA